MDILPGIDEPPGMDILPGIDEATGEPEVEEAAGLRGMDEPAGGEEPPGGVKPGVPVPPPRMPLINPTPT